MPRSDRKRPGQSGADFFASALDEERKSGRPLSEVLRELVQLHGDIGRHARQISSTTLRDKEVLKRARQYSRSSNRADRTVFKRMSQICRKPRVQSAALPVIEDFLVRLEQFSEDPTVHGRSYRDALERDMESLDPVMMYSTLYPELHKLRALDAKLRSDLRTRLLRNISVEDMISRTEEDAHRQGLPKRYWWYHPICKEVLTVKDLAEHFKRDEVELAQQLKAYLTSNAEA